MPSTRKLLASPVPVPDWWRGREPQVQAFLDERVERGTVATLAVSPGGRPVRVVRYGEPEPHLRGRANWSSALAAGQPEAYFRRGPGVRRRPVLAILAGVHGQEIGGMVAALSLIRVLETGEDLAGRERPALREALGRLRLLVVPLANPDGRARCPYDGWVGLPTEEMHRWGQGTRGDGSLYGWPGCKAVHPMRGDVGILGAYYDDGGVNLMHDEWHAPMSDTTAALLRLAADEAPDVLLNLHGHESPPAVLGAAYVPEAVKHQIAAFATRCYHALEARGIPHGSVPAVGPDGPPGTPPPALNLTSAFFHAGVSLPMTFESPQGLTDGRVAFGYPAILALHHALFEAAAQWLCREQGET